jgi:hypothetical protein
MLVMSSEHIEHIEHIDDGLVHQQGSELLGSVEPADHVTHIELAPPASAEATATGAGPDDAMQAAGPGSGLAAEPLADSHAAPAAAAVEHEQTLAVAADAAQEGTAPVSGSDTSTATDGSLIAGTPAADTRYWFEGSRSRGVGT